MVKQKLIQALKKTAADLENGCKYEWGHMGRCNAGCLVQNLMDKTDTEIAKMVDFDLAEWSEHAKEYCNGSKKNVQDLFLNLQHYGLGYKDVMHIEHLSDPKVLSRLPQNGHYLRKNEPKDVSVYMLEFAKQLQEASYTA